MLRARQEVLPFAAEAVLGKVSVEGANEDTAVLLSDQELRLVSIRGDVRVGARRAWRVRLEHHSASS